jgi:hypothetical protein
MEVLQNDENLKVLINDFGQDAVLSRKIKAYHELLADYMMRRDSEGVIHILGDYRSFI